MMLHQGEPDLPRRSGSSTRSGRRRCSTGTGTARPGRRTARGRSRRTGARIKKLSRGQLRRSASSSAWLARAELTLFDEPYPGLDAVARQMFYDRLLADYAEHPRTSCCPLT